MAEKEFNSHELRCVHRHYWPDHKSCFMNGRIDYDSKKFKKLEGVPWYDSFKIGYLDIETDGLKADFSTMLSWCIKERNGDIKYSVITKNELFNGSADKNLIKSCVEELKKYDIICTYYGKMFDIPYLRAKSFHYGIEFPGFTTDYFMTKNGKTVARTNSDVYHFDIYFLVRSKFSLSRKSLENVCDYLGIKGKTKLDPEIWRRGKYGDPSALKEILSHNKQDVIILESLHKKIENQAKWIKSPL